MRSKFERKVEMRAEENRALCSAIIDVSDERRDRSDQDPAKARNVSTRELAMEYPESGESGV